MPDESCRRCGGLLLDLLVCAQCRTTTQFICRICTNVTLPRYNEQVCFKSKTIDQNQFHVLEITNKGMPQNKQ